MENGMIEMPKGSGLGEDINFDYIKANTLKKF